MDHTSDHDDFWGDLPDWTLEADQPRPRRRSMWAARRSRPRLHEQPTGPTDPTDEFDGANDDWDPGDWTLDEEPARPRREQPPTGGVDPLLARFGAAAVVLTLMVPLALNVADDGVDELVATAEAAAPANGATSDGGTAPVVTLSDPTSSVEADPDATPTHLDPADLPPAIPVNDIDEASTDSDTATEADAELARSQAEASTDTTESSDGDDSAAGIDDGADVDDQADRLRVECAATYTLASGDYWIGLADRAEIELATLLAANDATVDTPLYPGTDICLPAGATMPAAPTTVAPTPTVTPTTAAPTTTSTTTTSTTTTTTTTTVPVVPVGPDEIVQIIRDVWPDELEERALEVAYRESRYVPTAKNFCCYGLFQIYWNVHQGWLSDLGITSATDLYDPETNARAAYALYERAGGWGPWSL